MLRTRDCCMEVQIKYIKKNYPNLLDLPIQPVVIEKNGEPYNQLQELLLKEKGYYLYNLFTMGLINGEWKKFYFYGGINSDSKRISEHVTAVVYVLKKYPIVGIAFQRIKNETIEELNKIETIMANIPHTVNIQKKSNISLKSKINIKKLHAFINELIQLNPRKLEGIVNKINGHLLILESGDNPTYQIRQTKYVNEYIVSKNGKDLFRVNPRPGGFGIRDLTDKEKIPFTVIEEAEIRKKREKATLNEFHKGFSYSKTHSNYMEYNDALKLITKILNDN